MNSYVSTLRPVAICPYPCDFRGALCAFGIYGLGVWQLQRTRRDAIWGVHPQTFPP